MQPIRFRIVLFPAPDGPAMARNSPFSMRMETPRSASTRVSPSM